MARSRTSGPTPGLLNHAIPYLLQLLDWVQIQSEEPHQALRPIICCLLPPQELGLELPQPWSLACRAN